MRPTAVILLLLSSVALTTCSSRPETMSPIHPHATRQPEKSFFERLSDHLTERECNVVRFTCPYGFGPAGEPCECVDGRGFVLSGRTIK